MKPVKKKKLVNTLITTHQRRRVRRRGWMADGWTAGTRTSRHRAPGQIVFEGTIPAPAAAAAKKKRKERNERVDEKEQRKQEENNSSSS